MENPQFWDLLTGFIAEYGVGEPRALWGALAANGLVQDGPEAFARLEAAVANLDDRPPPPLVAREIAQVMMREGLVTRWADLDLGGDVSPLEPMLIEGHAMEPAELWRWLVQAGVAVDEGANGERFAAAAHRARDARPIGPTPAWRLSRDLHGQGLTTPRAKSPDPQGAKGARLALRALDRKALGPNARPSIAQRVGGWLGLRR